MGSSIKLYTQQIAKLIANQSMTTMMIVGVPLFLLPSQLLTHTVHESGHGLACWAQGGTVPDWWAALRPAGTMDCKPTINVLTTIGGAVLQLSVWIVATVVLMWLGAHWAATQSLWRRAFVVFWATWSLHNVLQPISWMNYMSSTNGTEWDPARFIRLTHIDPATVVTASWVIFALSVGIAAACAIRLARPMWTATKNCHALISEQQRSVLESLK